MYAYHVWRCVIQMGRQHNQSPPLLPPPTSLACAHHALGEREGVVMRHDAGFLSLCVIIRMSAERAVSNKNWVQLRLHHSGHIAETEKNNQDIDT